MPIDMNSNPGLTATNGRWLTVGELIAYFNQFPADTPVTAYTRDAVPADMWVNVVSASNPNDTGEDSIILDTRNDFDTRQW